MSEEEGEELAYGVREWYQEKLGIYVHFTWPRGHAARSPGRRRDCECDDLGGGKPLGARGRREERRKRGRREKTVRHPLQQCFEKAHEYQYNIFRRLQVISSLKSEKLRSN